MTRQEFVLVVDPDGSLRFVYDDALRFLHQLGTARIRRASHVEPTADGQWTADLSPVGGPLLGPYHTRQAALAHERRWLETHLTALSESYTRRSNDG